MIIGHFIKDPQTLQEFYQLEARLLGGKLRIWDSMVNARYQGFSSERMIYARNSGPEMEIFSTLTTVDTKNIFNDHMNIGSEILGKKNFKFPVFRISFGICHRNLPDEITGGLVRVNIPSIKYDKAIVEEFNELGLFDALIDATKKCSRYTNHDFIHNGTLFAKIFDYNFMNDNRRSVFIEGYELYSLVLHQAIYAELRKEPGTVETLMSAFCEYDDIINQFIARSIHPEKEQITYLLNEFLHYMMRNLVAGREFLGDVGLFSKDRTKWQEALTSGQMEPFKGFVIRTENSQRPISLEEISMACYREFTAMHSAILMERYSPGISAVDLEYTR